MRRILLSLAAVTAIVSAASLTPAQAMTVGTAAGIKAAVDDAAAVQDVAYVCRHNGYNSLRRCWYTRPYYYRPYRRYYRRW